MARTGMYSRSKSELRARETVCRARVEDLEASVLLREIPDVWGLCDVVGTLRGRAIQLVAHPLSPSTTGYWLAGEAADTIYYAQDESLPQQQHIILHELAHILHQHDPLMADVEVLQQEIFSLLGPDRIRAALARSRYDAAHEQEAELLASLIEQRWAAARAQSTETPLFWGRSS